MQINTQVRPAAPQLASSVSVAKAPQVAQPTQFNSAPRFGAAKDPNRGGFFGWLSRVWKQFVGERHQAMDEKIRQNPIPTLKEEKTRLENKYKEVKDGLTQIIAEYIVSNEELEKIRAHAEESQQALMDFAKEVNKMRENKQTPAEELAETEALLAQDMQENETAQNTLRRKELEVQAKELKKLDAEAKLETAKTSVQEKLAEIREAAENFKDKQTLDKLEEIEQQSNDLLNQEIGENSELNDLMRDLKKDKVATQTRLNDGKSVAQRLAAAKAAKTKASVRKNTALDELLAKAAGKTTTTETPQTNTNSEGGDPFDAVTKK